MRHCNCPDNNILQQINMVMQLGLRLLKTRKLETRAEVIFLISTILDMNYILIFNKTLIPDWKRKDGASEL